mgnify:CR=1 FL=1
MSDSQPDTTRRWLDGVTELLRGASVTVGAPRDEAQDNLWLLAFKAEDAAALGAAGGARLIERARAELASATAPDIGPRLRFYTWFDELAGQLRFSVTSAEQLPFGALVRTTTDAIDVAERLVASPYLDALPWTELEGGGGDMGEDPVVEPVLVHVRTLVDRP